MHSKLQKRTVEQGDLKKELEVLFNSQNKSTSKDGTSISATFLRVTVTLDEYPATP
jgi:hypothetical protein